MTLFSLKYLIPSPIDVLRWQVNPIRLCKLIIIIIIDVDHLPYYIATIIFRARRKNPQKRLRFVEIPTKTMLWTIYILIYDARVNFCVSYFLTQRGGISDFYSDVIIVMLFMEPHSPQQIEILSFLVLLVLRTIQGHTVMYYNYYNTSPIALLMTEYRVC